MFYGFSCFRLNWKNLLSIKYASNRTGFNCVAKRSVKNFLPMQPGDVPCTYADVDDLIKDVGFKPATPIEDGIHRFVQWYREYYKN